MVKEKASILHQWILGEYENIKVRNIGFTKTFNWETNKTPEFNAVSKMFIDAENPNIYRQSFDFIDATLTELKLFNESKDLDKAVKVINELLRKKGIELFLINELNFEEFRNKIKST